MLSTKNKWIDLIQTTSRYDTEHMGVIWLTSLKESGDYILTCEKIDIHNKVITASSRDDAKAQGLKVVADYLQNAINELKGS